MHFTEGVVEALRGRLLDVSGDRAEYRDVITAQQLIEVAELLPKEELAKIERVISNLQAPQQATVVVLNWLVWLIIGQLVLLTLVYLSLHAYLLAESQV